MPYKLSGASQYLYRAVTTAAHQITGDLTVAVEFNLDVLPATDVSGVLVAHSASGEAEDTNYLYAFSVKNISGTGKLRSFHENAAGNNNSVETSHTIVPGTDYKLMVSRDTTAKTLSWYLNGFFLGSDSYTNNATGGTSGKLYIGSNGTGEFFDGPLGNVAIWNAALGLTEHIEQNDGKSLREISPGDLVSVYILGGGTEYDLIGGYTLSKNGSLSTIPALVDVYSSPNLYPDMWQGYTTDGVSHFNSDNALLQRRTDDASWTVEASNSSPFTSLPAGSDHLGDISEHAGDLYGVVEKLGGGPAIVSLVKYSASTLGYSAHADILARGKAAGVGVDPEEFEVFVVGFGVSTGADIYDLSLTYQRTVTYQFPMTDIQSCAIKADALYVLTTTGIIYQFDKVTGDLYWYEQLDHGYEEYEGIEFSQDTCRYTYHDASTEKVTYLVGVPRSLLKTIEIGNSFTYTLPTLSGSHSNFPVRLIADDFPAKSLDGTSGSFSDGAGELKAYTDSDKVTQLPVDIVEFTVGGSPQVEIYIKLPTAETGSTIYIEKDDVQTTQPASGAAYGRNAVWSDYEAVIHLNEVGSGVVGEFADSTGNGNTASVKAGTSSQSRSLMPWGGQWQSLGGTTDYLEIDGSENLLDNSDFLVQLLWARTGALSGSNLGVIGNRDISSGNDYWLLRINSSQTLLQTKDGTTYRGAEASAPPLAAPIFSHMQVDASGNRVELFKDGVSVASNTTDVGGDPGFVSGNPTRIGSWYDYDSTRDVQGRFGRVRIRLSILSALWIADEVDNLSAASNWGVVGDWIDSAVGGGVTLEGTLESISFTSNPASIALDAGLAATLASILVSENTADVALDRSIIATTENIAVAENQAGTSLDIALSGNAETIQVEENTASVSTDISVSGSFESIQVTENPADIAVDVFIVGTQEQITVTENPASLGLGISAVAEQITLSEFVASVSTDRAITGSLETIQVVQPQASVAVGFNATTESIVLTENQSTVRLDTALSASLETIVLNELAAQIDLSQNIDASLQSLTLTEAGAIITFDSGISAVLESISLSALSATISSSTLAPTIAGLEYTMAGSKMHFTLPINRLHYTFKSED